MLPVQKLREHLSFELQGIFSTLHQAVIRTKVSENFGISKRQFKKNIEFKNIAATSICQTNEIFELFTLP